MDKLHAADPGRVYATVCLRAVDAFHVVAGRLHMPSRSCGDTTSVSVEGAYEGETPSGALGVTYGYSKDHST